MARVVNCEFLRFSCGHDLFNATYTRSNRTKGTKIMRCFPHCCPEHMPRCYCGCSLQVLVSFENVGAVRLDELLVCARFETSEQQEPRHRVAIGSALTIPKALLSTNPDDANATAWVLAEKESDVKQREVAKNSVLYVMNNHRFPRWYYSYESGATKNQREMRHHLTVYILQRTRHPSADHGDVERVQVIGRLASPSFKLVSYRRARGEVKKPAIPEHDDPLAALEDQGPSATSEEEEDGNASTSTIGTPTKTPPPPRTNSKAIDSNSDSESSPAPRLSETRCPDLAVSSLAKDLARRRANSSPFVTVAPKQEHSRRSESDRRASFYDDVRMKEEDEEQGVPRAPRKRKASSPAAKTFWWRQHSDDAQRVLHLHVLFVMLNRLSLHEVMFCLREKSDRLRKKWFETIAAKHCDGRVTARLSELARAFCLSVFAEDATRPSGGVEYAHADTRTVIATCLDVLVEVAMSDAVAKLLQATWDSHQSEVLESEHIRVLFIQFVRRLHGAIDATVRNRRKSTPPATNSKALPGAKPAASAPSLPASSLGLAGLVDDAMTAVFREKTLMPLRRDMARALSDSTWAAESWYRVFVAQLRVAWVHFNERKASGINLLWQAAQKTTAPLWNGKWLLDASSFRVRRPGGWFHPQKANADDISPLGSAVSWILLLRQWMAVEFTMDGVTLSVTSLLTKSSGAGLKLVLDERRRVFASHPDGLASTIGCGGGDRGTWLHGDYVGRSRDDSSELLCETYSIRQTHHAEILRLAIKASIWSAADGARRCVVAIQLASATCERFSAEQLNSWPVAARHERLYATVKWNVLADVEATYHNLK